MFGFSRTGRRAARVSTGSTRFNIIAAAGGGEPAGCTVSLRRETFSCFMS
jgi:hypothetical protein